MMLMVIIIEHFRVFFYRTKRNKIYLLGPDVEYSTTTFEDFAASDEFKEVKTSF